LDFLQASGVPTIGIGKIDDLFSGRGLQKKIHIKSNAEGIEEIIKTGKTMQSGFLMANLVDFDMLFGHRQDAKGYAEALEEFDAKLPEIQKCIGDNDILILTADHGNDPTDRSMDHTREYAPVLCYTKSGKKNVNLGVRSSFADIGKTVAEFFNAANTQPLSGQSFLTNIL
jgi:phosphopentomutase